MPGKFFHGLLGSHGSSEELRAQTASRGLASGGEGSDSAEFQHYQRQKGDNLLMPQRRRLERVPSRGARPAQVRCKLV